MKSNTFPLKTIINELNFEKKKLLFNEIPEKKIFIFDIKSVITEHPQTLHNVSKTIEKGKN